MMHFQVMKNQNRDLGRFEWVALPVPQFTGIEPGTLRTVLELTSIREDAAGYWYATLEEMGNVLIIPTASLAFQFVKMATEEE